MSHPLSAPAAAASFSAAEPKLNLHPDDDPTTTNENNTDTSTPKTSSSSSSSFFSFVRSEIFLNDSDSPTNSNTIGGQLPSQLVYNFLILPWYLEKLFTLGFMICLDCFLHLFTILPCRMIVGTIDLLRSIINNLLHTLRPSYYRRQTSTSASSPTRFIRLNGAQLCDICRGLLLITCWYGLAFINMSRLYHYIRGQSVLKLYVIFNMLQISDRLFCSFGEDILESLFASIQTLAAATPNNGADGAATEDAKGKSPQVASKHVQVLHVIFHFAISVMYVFGHSLILFAQVITLNVSVNSDNSSLFVVLVSNNFIELKGAVFKRFDHHNLMQISASDIVERFQLSIFLLVILIQNLAHIGLAFAGDWLEKAGFMCFMVLGGEWIVDWIKHGFITKFNGIPPIVYRHFAKVLCTDYIHTHKHKTESSIHSVSRRLGLPSLPIAVLVVRVVSQSFLLSPSHIFVKCSLLFVGLLCLTLLKCLLAIVLLGHASQRVIIEPLERDKSEAFMQALHAPAHQHLRTTKKVTTTTTILPKMAQQQTAEKQIQPTHAATTTTTTVDKPLSSSSLTVDKPCVVSSTHSSPSLFGLKGPMPIRSGTSVAAADTAAGARPLSPLALDASLRPIQFTRSPVQPTSVATPPPISVTPPTPSVMSHTDGPQLSVSVPDVDDDSSSVCSSSTGLATIVTSVPSSMPLPDECLTSRFGRIHTPTALERFGDPSAMTPEPITELEPVVEQQIQTTFNATIIQLEQSGQQGIITTQSTTHTSPTMQRTHTASDVELASRDSSSSSWSPPRASDSSVSTSSISVVSASTDQVEIVPMATADGASGAGGGETQHATSGSTALHIYHHLVPPQATTLMTSAPTVDTDSAHSSLGIGSSSPSTSSGSTGVGSDSASHPPPAPTSITFPPTVVTISSAPSNAAAPKEKSQPAYEDAQKIEQDLLTVQRYKISANKAIPV